MRKAPFLLSISIISIGMGCAKSSNDAPTPTLQRLPFDQFYLSTKFGDSNVPASANTYYFDTWMVLKPNTTSQDTYHYYSTDNATGIVPKECTRTYVKIGVIITATVKCTLQRIGTLKPNDLNWVQSLSYEAQIAVNISSNTLTSAKLKFPDYGQTIDFTSQAQMVYSNANGYKELIIGGGDYLVTTNDNFPLTVRCVFDEKQN